MSAWTAPLALQPKVGNRIAPGSGQESPRWVWWALGAILIATAVLYSWNIASSGYSDYYATAVKSMSVSWRAFFFGAFDPAATVTLDKLAGSLIPQALSVRMFGYSSWSLALPQVIEGLATVLVTFFIVNRWAGRAAGLIGAFMIAFTPLLVSMFSHAMEDGLLMLCWVVAIWAWQLSLDTGNARWLYLAGAIIGVAFQAKMMQAWIILPPFALVFFLSCHRRTLAKLRQLAAAGLVTVLVSISWMTAIALFPATARPYIDGTLNNNVFTMVFGYNGVNRFIKGIVPGALQPESLAAGTTTSTAESGIVTTLVNHTPIKFFLPEYASQIGWLYPLAAAGIVLGCLALRRPELRSGLPLGFRAGLLMSIGLLASTGIVMSVMILPHSAYLASMTFPLVALSTMGIILVLRSAKHAMRFALRSRLRYSMPVVILAQTAWGAALVASFASFTGALWVVVATVGLAAAIVAFAAIRGQLTHLMTAAGAVALMVALLIPTLWSFSTINPRLAGTANDANAGPSTPTLAERLQRVNTSYGIGLNSNRELQATASTEAKIYAYAAARSANAKYVISTDSWRSAAPLIMSGSLRVLPVGGYTSRIPSPTLSALQDAVSHNDLRFALLTGGTAKSGIVTPAVTAWQNWVLATCTPVAASAYDSFSRPPALWERQVDQLFDCAGPRVDNAAQRLKDQSRSSGG